MSEFIIKEFDPKLLEAFSFETPYFLFNRKKILQNYHQYKQLFPNALIQYAMKANSDLEVLNILAEAGCGFEVASVYELKILKKIKVSPKKIIYGTSVKPAKHIKEFVRYGVDRFACDSFEELEKIAAMAPGSRVYIRITANDSSSIFKFSEKFGTTIDDVITLLLKAKEYGLKPYGISFHVGSQASDGTAWEQVIRQLIPIFKELQKHNITLEVLNIGGGYPCNYLSSPKLPTLEEISQSVAKICEKLPYKPQLMLEPGRGVIADCGVAVGTVIARVERSQHTWLFLDLGVYNGLFETMAYQGSTRYPAARIRATDQSGEKMFAVAGPTGDSPDVVSREVLLPADTEVGDKIIFYNAGAYSLSVTSEFNGFPKPFVYHI